MEILMTISSVICEMFCFKENAYVFAKKVLCFISDNAVLIIALASAVAAVAAVVVTKRVAQIQLFVSWLRDYSSKEMHEALIRLGAWQEYKRQNPPAESEDFKERLSDWQEKRKNLTSNARNVVVARCDDEARRRVSHYFTTAKDFYKNKKCISKFFLKFICRPDSFKLVFDIVEWLEQAIRSDYAREDFDDLLKLCGRDDVEDLKKLRPPEKQENIKKDEQKQ